MLHLSKLLDPVLTPGQLKRLKEHKYKVETNSYLEYYIFDPFWNWLITMAPLWLAPNLITFIGFCTAATAALVTIIMDLNAEGKVRGREGGREGGSQRASPMLVPSLDRILRVIHAGDEYWVRSLGQRVQ